MSVSDDFKDFVIDQLAGFGPVSVRRMFGGAGIFAGDLMFAFIVDDTLYLKADARTVPAFEAEGLRPFTYTGKSGKPIAIDYWEAPPRLLEEPDELVEWANDAYAIARAAKKPSPKKAARKKSAKKKPASKRAS